VNRRQRGRVNVTAGKPTPWVFFFFYWRMGEGRQLTSKEWWGRVCKKKLQILKVRHTEIHGGDETPPEKGRRLGVGRTAFLQGVVPLRFLTEKPRGVRRGHHLPEQDSGDGSSSWVETQCNDRILTFGKGGGSGPDHASAASKVVRMRVRKKPMSPGPKRVDTGGNGIRTARVQSSSEHSCGKNKWDKGAYRSCPTGSCAILWRRSLRCRFPLKNGPQGR